MCDPGERLDKTTLSSCEGADWGADTAASAARDTNCDDVAGVVVVDDCRSPFADDSIAVPIRPPTKSATMHQNRMDGANGIKNEDLHMDISVAWWSAGGESPKS